MALGGFARAHSPRRSAAKAGLHSAFARVWRQSQADTDSTNWHGWGGPRWMAQGSDINGLMRLVFASARLSGPVQGRHNPGEGPASTRGGLRKILESHELRH